jgi:sugar phosphate isomerase/epimerase
MAASPSCSFARAQEEFHLLTRRRFLASSAALAATPGLLRAQAGTPLYPQRKLPFHVAVINDEIGPDFEHSCQVAATDFGLKFIELRTIGAKGIAAVNDAEIAEGKKILAKYSLQVSDLASPLFKVPFEKAQADGFAAQTEVLERCIHVARSLGTTRIRCFDFLRLEDQKPARAEINEQLRKASARLAKENCNTATGAQSAAVLAEVTNANFMLNWDPGNAAESGEDPFPYGYNLLPKNRIGHCHCKDAKKQPDGKVVWAPVGGGMIDWKGQLEALIQQKFTATLSLETHWKSGNGPEDSTRTSMAGLQKVLAEVAG